MCIRDSVHTVEIESRPMTQLGVADADHGMLLINDQPMSTASPDNSVYPLKMDLNEERRFVLQNAGRTIEIGRADGLFLLKPCLLYTSDAADERSSVDLGGRRII